MRLNDVGGNLFYVMKMKIYGGVCNVNYSWNSASAQEWPCGSCCRAEEGTELTPANFEDPAIFPDLIDTGLLNIDGALKLGQVLNGSKLTKTVDSLTPITPDIVDKYDEEVDEAAEETEEVAEAGALTEPSIGGQVQNVNMSVVGGVVKLYIGEGKDIAIEFPV